MKLTYYVEIVRYSDDEVVKRMGPMLRSVAEKCARGATRNMGEDYFSRVVDE